MLAIFKREFRSYFQNVIGWLFVAAVLAVYGIYFFAYNLAQGSPYISSPLSAVTIVLLIGVPILSMRCFSEERKNKTDQLTLTAPVSVGKIVFGKYLAMAAVFTIDILIFALTPLILSVFGTVPFGESYVVLLGFWLFGCTYLAVGMFLSSLTESQVISAVLTFVILFLTFMMSGIISLLSSEENLLTKFLNIFDVYSRFGNFTGGCLDIAGCVYFLSLIALLCFLTCQSIQKRRWSISRKTFSTGVFSTGLVAVGVALAVVVNLIVSQLPVTLTSIDCSYSKLYEVTEDTEKVLENLDTDITLYVLAAENSKDETLDQTLKRYESLSKHITVTYVSPAKNPNFYQQYTDTAPTQNSIIVVSEQRSRVIDMYDIYDYQIDYSTYNYELQGYDAEGQLTSAIEYVSKDSSELPVIYQITGHQETLLGSNFSEALEKANVTLESLELLNEESVPEDASALIINAPQTDFNEEDAQKVIDYLKNGGKVLITGLYASQGLENFESILAAYNVSFVDGIIAENDQNYYYYQSGPFYLFPKVESTEYTSSVSNAYIFLPLCEGIVYPEDEEETDIAYTPLLSTTDKSVSKVNWESSMETYELEEGDESGPFTVALAVEAAAENGSADTQLVVMGSPYFLDDTADAAISGNNSTLFTSIISRFVGETDLSGSVIPEKEVSLGALTISAFWVGALGMLLTIVIPLILLALGIVIWILRRKK